MSGGDQGADLVGRLEFCPDDTELRTFILFVVFKRPDLFRTAV